ncbi:MAG: cytochrome c [Bdellovibrionales bacterium]|nr:cytochrome c [Bdellovibrionales bacterium]
MKTTLKVLGSLLGIGVLLLVAVLTYAHLAFVRQTGHHYSIPDLGIAAEMPKADIEIGKRIVTVRNGCTDCHGEDLSGRQIMDDPAMGTFYGANITPYALKDWSDEEIAKAIRSGVNRKGHSLIFMPSYEYQSLSKEDLAAIIAYLRQVPAIEKANPPARVGALAKVLSAFNKIPVLLPATQTKIETPFTQKPPEEATQDFGRYLVESACVGCHGPALQGGPIPGGPPDWPSATSLRLGAEGWTEEDFVNTVRTGVSAKTKTDLRAPMPVALLKQLSETEVRAMWMYLSQLK